MLRVVLLHWCILRVIKTYLLYRSMMLSLHFSSVFASTMYNVSNKGISGKGFHAQHVCPPRPASPPQYICSHAEEKIFCAYVLFQNK